MYCLLSLGEYLKELIIILYLFGFESLWCTEVFSIIVAEVIVADDGLWFDASTHQEVSQHRLQFGLSRFEVISSYKNSLLLCQLNTSRDKSVLWGAIDVCHLKSPGNT